jgi:hypothetical protein
MRFAFVGFLSVGLVAACQPALAQTPFQQALQQPVPARGPAIDAFVRNLAMAAIVGGRAKAPEADAGGAEAEDDPVLPDPALTPGLVAEHSASKVCRDGYSRERRRYDPTAVAQIFASYGVSGSRHDYEDDHLVPIKLGGDPVDKRNQWPQPRFTERWNAEIKDHLEWRLINWVCQGDGAGADQRLAQAQSDMMSSWIAAYPKYCPSDSDCPGYGKD